MPGCWRGWVRERTSLCGVPVAGIKKNFSFEKKEGGSKHPHIFKILPKLDTFGCFSSYLGGELSRGKIEPFMSFLLYEVLFSNFKNLLFRRGGSKYPHIFKILPELDTFGSFSSYLGRKLSRGKIEPFRGGFV